MKINASMGLTICTNEQARNFVRLGIDITDIDPAGDVEVQARAAMIAWVKVVGVIDDQLQEELTEVLATYEGVPIKVRDDLKKLKEELTYVKDALIPNVVQKVKTLSDKVS